MSQNNKDDSKNKSEVSEVTLDADTHDPLLQSLVYLTALFGRAKSAQALTAGLAYDENNMRPSLFCEAAERLGLKTQIVKKGRLASIPQSVLPVVLILKDEQACVLLAVKGKKAKIYLPETGSEKQVTLKKLQADYAGYAIYIHPRSEFTNPETVHLEDTDRHWFWGIVKQNQ